MSSNVTPSTPAEPSLRRASAKAWARMSARQNLVVQQIEAEPGLRLRLHIKLPLKGSDLIRRFQTHRQSPLRSSSKAPLKQGAFAPPALPGLNALTPLSDSRFQPTPSKTPSRPNLAGSGSPLITRSSLPTCRAQYPDGPHGCACRCLPHGCGLPHHRGGSASVLNLSRPAQASLALQPAGSLSRPRRPLSRGSNPGSYPPRPLASYRTHRHLSGWDLPPLEKRALRAHTVTVHLTHCTLSSIECTVTVMP